MGRGKIEIKKIENTTSRQVTYSKRRNGLFKKAKELNVLCDAKVFLIIISNTGRFREFVSPNTTIKEMLDDYQHTSGVDLWITHYQVLFIAEHSRETLQMMQETLRRLKELNLKLRTQIKQRMGEELNQLRIDELRSLEQSMTSSVNAIRERKYHVIKQQTSTCRKKVKNLEQIHEVLLGFNGLVSENEERNYNSTLSLGNETLPNNLHSLHLHHERPDSFASHSLRLV
ncbi:Agamous-like MADS-box protein TM6 [Linum perenne]